MGTIRDKNRRRNEPGALNLFFDFPIKDEITRSGAIKIFVGISYNFLLISFFSFLVEACQFIFLKKFKYLNVLK